MLALESLPVLEVKECAAEHKDAQENECDDAVELIQAGQVNEEHLDADHGEKPESDVAECSTLLADARQNQPQGENRPENRDSTGPQCGHEMEEKRVQLQSQKEEPQKERERTRQRGNPALGLAAGKPGIRQNEEGDDSTEVE